MLLNFLDEADLLSSHITNQLRGVLADGVRVSVAYTGVPSLAISLQSLTGMAGSSRATSSMIDPSRLKDSAASYFTVRP
jgi:hypothetical protein